ncbi:unnamed protein product [Soboliphyme baturini]|uniref:Sema domain-containing protein n=1 Tax=Soboliphyme baturini TaxID=241478 RepID=A0A183ISD9_9BILA|nr:unnamed protein product [Soboliphyme baturini]
MSNKFACFVAVGDSSFTCYAGQVKRDRLLREEDGHPVQTRLRLCSRRFVASPYAARSCSVSKVELRKWTDGGGRPVFYPTVLSECSPRPDKTLPIDQSFSAFEVSSV